MMTMSIFASDDRSDEVEWSIENSEVLAFAIG